MSRTLIHVAIVAVSFGFAILMNEVWHLPVLGFAIAGGVQAVAAQLIFVPKEKQTAARYTVAVVVGVVGCAILGYVIQNSTKM